MQALQAVIGGEVDASHYYLISDEELKNLQQAAEANVPEVVWKSNDVIRSLGGVKREKFIRVIVEHRDELVKIGALLSYPEPGHGTRSYKFRVSIIVPWLDEHLNEFNA